jgi:predicted glycoside hydrolase/deacetylase ChbG (UPF0249 family)
MKNYQHELITMLDHMVDELASDGRDPVLPRSLFVPPTGQGFFQMGVPFQEATALGPNPAMKKMGYADNDRCLIVHVDDIGLSQSNVEGFSELVDVGLVTSGSVMMPTAWSAMACEYARTHPNADMGVHLTLTSEWEGNRWGALSTVDPATGLVDENGYMWQHGEDLFPRTKSKYVKKEMETQVLAAIKAGMDPTHFDSHQFVALQTYIMPYIQLCLKHKLAPIFIRRDRKGFEAIAGMDPGFIGPALMMVKAFELFKIPLLDNMYMMPLENPDTRLEDTKTVLHMLTPGITFFIIHATKPSPELGSITSDSLGRFADYHTWMSEDMRTFLQDEGIHLIGWRALKNIMP